MAIPLALIVNELLTNAVKYAGAPCTVALRGGTDGALTLTIVDAGSGPKEQHGPGFGTRIVEAFSTQLNARIETKQDASGFRVDVVVPLPVPRNACGS